MKSTKGWFISSILLLIIGIVLVISPNTESFTPFIAIGMITSGLLMFILGCLIKIGEIRPRYYKFIHLLNRDDITDKSAEIIGEINKKDITQPWNWHKLPIQLKQANFCKIGPHSYIKLIGVIYANTEEEALKILNNQVIDVKLLESETLLSLMS
jgi:hypothetical protein